MTLKECSVLLDSNFIKIHNIVQRAFNDYDDYKMCVDRLISFQVPFMCYDDINSYSYRYNSYGKLTVEQNNYFAPWIEIYPSIYELDKIEDCKIYGII